MTFCPCSASHGEAVRDSNNRHELSDCKLPVAWVKCACLCNVLCGVCCLEHRRRTLGLRTDAARGVARAQAQCLRQTSQVQDGVDLGDVQVEGAVPDGHLGALRAHAVARGRHRQLRRAAHLARSSNL